MPWKTEAHLAGPNHFPSPRDKLVEFYERNISANAATENPETGKWREGFDERLGL